MVNEMQILQPIQFWNAKKKSTAIFWDAPSGFLRMESPQSGITLYTTNLNSGNSAKSGRLADGRVQTGHVKWKQKRVKTETKKSGFLSVIVSVFVCHVKWAHGAGCWMKAFGEIYSPPTTPTHPLYTKLTIYLQVWALGRGQCPAKNLTT